MTLLINSPIRYLSFFTFILLVLTIHHVTALEHLHVTDCGTSFFLCEPQGASTDTIGLPGSAWKELYSKILSAISEAAQSRTDISTTTGDGPAKRENVFCCVKNSECLLLNTFEVPMCWDRFTTNVFFPDGAHGSIVSGNLSTAAGDTADLIYGTYFRRDGTVGNIYDESGETILPDTQSLHVPTPWTSNGVGTPVPLTELGTMAVLSTATGVLSATTQPAMTLPSLTVTMIATMSGCGHCGGSNTTIPGLTIPASTNPEFTSVYMTGVTVPPFVGGAPHVNLLRTFLLSMFVAGARLFYP